LTAHQTVTLESGTNSGTLKLTTAAGTVDNIAVKGLGSLAYKASLVASDIPDISGTYVTLSGSQTISGAKTFSGGIIMSGASIVAGTDSTCTIGTSSNRFSEGSIRNLHVTTLDFRDGSSPNTQIGKIYCGGDIMQFQLGSSGSNGHFTFGSSTGLFHSGNGNVPCGRSDHRWSYLYGVNADLTGDLSLASTSHIDIGPLRIEYDATNKALHITKKNTNDTNNYGIYADGFVSAGGVGQTS
jgi:hypothetical protein